MLKLYAKNNPPERIEQVVSVLRDGGVIIYPTGTTYALGCHALKERAVERICKIRQIDPSSHPLSVICYDMSKNKLPKIFRSKKSGEIGIRMPDSEIVRDILQQLDAPLMTASLPTEEFEDEAYRLNPELIDETFGSQVDMVIDGGMGILGESTVVDCREDDYEIIRQGDGILV